MNVTKINPWIAGITLIFAASLIIYFESYRNNEWIDIIAYVSGFSGWMILFTQITKGTSVDAEKVLFKDDMAGWFKQRISTFFYYLVLMVVIFGSGYLMLNLVHDRKQEILADQTTKTTVAIIDHIEVSTGRRGGTTYHAIFQYTANGKATSYRWYEDNEFDFLVGDKYLIKYSVEYPQMFTIVNKLP